MSSQLEFRRFRDVGGFLECAHRRAQDGQRLENGVFPQRGRVPVSSLGADPEVEHEAVLQVIIRLRGDPGIGSPCVGSSAANRLKRNLELGEREADGLEETAQVHVELDEGPRTIW